MNALSKKMLGILTTIVSMSACSYTTAEPVKFADRDTDGFRFYDVKPLLVITPTNTNVIYVPDFERGYSAQLGAILTKNKSIIKINNSVLSEVEGDLDATGPLSGFFSYASTALTEGAKLGAVISESISGGVPGRYGVFEFELDDAGQIVNLRPITGPTFLDQLINVPSSGATGDSGSAGGGNTVVGPQ
jgi:hypothetical protein